MDVSLPGPISWQHRDRDIFGVLRLYGRPLQPVVEFSPPGASALWDPLRSAWFRIRKPGAIIEAVADENGQLLLRYPAINWFAKRIAADADYDSTVAVWLIDVLDTYSSLMEQFGDEIRLFCNPRLKLDFANDLRVVFLPSPPDLDAPREIRDRKPTWDERSTVYMTGSLVSRLLHDARGPAGKVIGKCTEDKPRHRYPTVRALLQAIETEFRVDVEALRRREPEQARAAEGLAWLELGELERADEAFIDAKWSARMKPFVEVFEGFLNKLRTSAVSEASFAALLERSVPPEQQLSRATEALRQGDIGFAASLAHKIRAREPENYEASRILVEVHLKNGKHQDALAVLEDLPIGDAKTWYLRAKVLFAAKRLHEARDAFDLAFKRDPSMLEAMLLRREVERALASVRAMVGDGNEMDIPIPAALANLRDVLLSGDAKRAIAALEDEHYASKPDAQLVRARFLSLDGQHERALEVYDRIGGEHRFTALLGKARTLLDLGRDQSALALFDELVAEKPTDAEASEGRARALEKLGRVGEAAAEYRRFIALATAGSDLRVRAAQAWLDDHPL
jgi:tetratricopeptide (TPR) repeat protein